MQARTQIEYARLLLENARPGDRERAAALLEAALASARELGMSQLVERALALKRRAPQPVVLRPQPPTPDPRSSAAIFRREGDSWELGYGGAEVRLKDSKGLRYIAHLLRHPGRGFPATELVTLEGGATTDDAERARWAVTKRIKSALARVRSSHPELGRHLSAAIVTGALCGYFPGPDEFVRWLL